MIDPSRQPQTFMKVGPRNAMVIAVCSLAVGVDRERGELRAAYGSAGPVPALVTAPLDARADFPQLVAAAASPIDDVRGTAAYRRHALRGADQARAGSGARMKIAAGRQRRAARGRRLGGREPALTTLREHARAARLEERLRAGRVRLLLGAARRRRSSAPASSSPRRRTGTRSTTVEGLRGEDGLHRVQQAFVEAGAVQCGFCTPGLVVATAALLERVPSPSDDEIREALSGNLCRCTGYAKIFDAVRLRGPRA